MSEVAIRLADVSKRFRLTAGRRQGLKERAVRGRSPHADEFWALKNATFDIRAGSTFGLIGPNGAGKSTTLKVVAGIYRPTSGTVEIRGRMSALLELGAGFHPELTGRENIALNGSILGMSPLEIEAATDSIVDFADIGEHIDAPVKVYSSGMYVRLGFAIAVAVKPEILVVDEVIAVGDEQFQRKCFDHLYALRRAGTTIVLVSHSMATIEDLCDEAAWIQGGEVRQQGPSRGVVRKYLNEVNAQRSQVDERTGLEHIGSGEALIERVDIVGPDGELGDTLVSEQPAEFQIHFEAFEELPGAIFGLALIHESGVRVAGPNSHERGTWTVPAGPGTATFRMESCLLRPGSYRLSAAIVDRGHFVDNVVEQIFFKVVATGGTESGLVVTPGAWSLSTC